MTRTESSKPKITHTETKSRAVKQMRFHIGVQVPGIVLNSIDCEKHDCKMELLPFGVEAHIKGSVIIVPYANIHYIEMLKVDQK